MDFTSFLVLLTSSMYTGYVYASLTVSPERSQFFKYESLSLSCHENRSLSGWRVKAKTVRRVSECGSDWGSVQASSCVINEAYGWNTGVYWCESTSGETSPAVNISITEGNVILESQVSPVREGESVTLRCTAQSNSSNLQTSIFMKDQVLVGATTSGQMVLSAVSRSDEGLYMCKITETGASPESWLAVTGPDAAAWLPSVSRLMCHVLVGAPYLLSTIVLGLLLRDKMKPQPVQVETNCDDVKMEEEIM